MFITAGRRAAQFIARTRPAAGRRVRLRGHAAIPEARAIAAFARDLFLKGEVDQVQVVATRFVNTLTQQPVCLEFLPVGEIKGLKIEGAQSEEELAANTTDFLFEPTRRPFLSYLLSHYLNIYLYQVLLNAKASEQSAGWCR